MESRTTDGKCNARLMRWLVFLSRLVVGGTFVFSGFVKAIDPYGTAYKFEDYFAAFHLEFLSSFTTLFAVALAVVEFLLGVHLLFGSYRKSTPRLVFLFLCVMTPLTLYLAIANPISDCGCFGDAVHLSNWATFFKNVVLLGLTVFLLYTSKRLRGLYNKEVQWLTGLYSLVFVLFFCYIGINYQPYLDFRPYKIGVNIPEALSAGEPQREFVFIYEKVGKRQEFTLDNLPAEEEGWTFVDRYEKATEAPAAEAPAIDEFTIYRGDTDITDEILTDESYYILLLSPDLEKADDSEVDRINELYDYCVERGYGFACVTASSPKGAEVWLENTGAEYPFYFMDKTTIRTIARGNPCVLLLKGGTILRKTAPSQLPDETQLTQPLDQLDYGRPEVYRPHRRIGFIIVAYLLPMLVLLLTEKTIAMIIGRVKLWRLNRIRRRRAERDALAAFGGIEVMDDSPRDSKPERTVEKPLGEVAQSTGLSEAEAASPAPSSDGGPVRKGRKEK
ncbi:BT_3928 family protein [Barnesiella viscericola]|uniref:BT_3928 family protein n=1 Tax=Barnesiella viscericola TaxID=397865 RepID=UPI0024B6F01B|nr:BT_3928 family protein [Barnesiella viscericola]